MFNNPLRKYQEGGQAPSKEQEQMMAAFVQWLPTKIPEFQKMKPEQIVQQLNQLSQTEEGKNYIMNLMAQFNEEYKSQSIRNGGKVHDFICKHAKGGRVDCGCGGTKIAFGEDGFSDGMPKGTRRITAQKDTVEIYPLGNIAEVTRKSYFGKPGVVDYNVMYDNATRRVSTNPVLLNNIGIFARPFVSAGFASDRITPEYQKQLESARNNTDFEVKEKKNGGIVKGQNGAVVTTDTTSPLRRKMLSFIDDTPALRHIQQGFNNFKQSAPGKVLSFFMPNPNSETGMLGAAAPIGKVSSLGKAASKLDDEVKVLGYYDDLGNFIKTEGDDVVRNIEKYRYNQKP